MSPALLNLAVWQEQKWKKRRKKGMRKWLSESIAQSRTEKRKEKNWLVRTRE